MAANTGQGRSFTTFLVGLVLACVGIAYFSSGLGKPVFAVGLVIFVVSLFGFLKLKPLEGKPAMNASPTVMKLVGVILSAFGWGITLFGVHMTDGNAGQWNLGPSFKDAFDDVTPTIPNLRLRDNTADAAPPTGESPVGTARAPRTTAEHR